MEKINLYIDFDGVILDTITPTYDALHKKGITDKDEITKFFTNYNWNEIINDKYILNDAINSINEIIESDKFNLAILTHVNSLNEGMLKINYLRKYFEDITIILCPKQISKTKMVHTKDAILVDDYSENLREWQKAGGISVKFSKEVKSKEFKVVTHLNEIIDMF